MFQAAYWPRMPSRLYFSSPYGVVVKQTNQQGTSEFVKGKRDDEVDAHFSLKCQRCVGSIYCEIKGTTKLLGSGTIVHLFGDSVPQEILDTRGDREDGFDNPIGIVLTSAHLIRNNKLDVFATLYFSLNSNFTEKGEENQMQLVPLVVGEKSKEKSKEEKEHFIDPITRCTALHDNDVEILLILGKTKMPELESAAIQIRSEEEMNLIQHSKKRQEWQQEHQAGKDDHTQDDQQGKPEEEGSKLQPAESLYLVGYPASLEKADPDKKELQLRMLCPKMSSSQQISEYSDQIIHSLHQNSRNYVKCQMQGVSENMVAVDASAYNGMSGGPLLRVKGSQVEVVGVLSSSAVLPFLRAFQDFIKAYLTHGWRDHSQIQRNPQQLDKLDKILETNEQREKLRTIDSVIQKYIKNVNSYIGQENELDLDITTLHDQENLLITAYQNFTDNVSDKLISLGIECNHNLCVYGGSRMKQIVEFIGSLQSGESLRCYHSLTPQPRYIRRNFQILNAVANQNIDLNYQKSVYSELSLKKIGDKLNQAQNQKLGKLPQWDSTLVGLVIQAEEGVKDEFKDYQGLNEKEFKRMVQAYIRQEGIRDLI